MASEWYYTTNKEQMGPVSWDELRELAEAGILKAHDMVWAEGMAEWVKAIHQRGLFADEGIEDASAKKKSKAQPPPGRRRRAEDEEENDEEDERAAKRKARKAEQERAKMGVWIKVGLILGGILFVVLLCGGCGVGIFIVAFRGDGGGGGGEKLRESYTVNNLPPGRDNLREFRLTKGRRVVITVTNDVQFPQPDVDLLVFRTSNNQLIQQDIRIPAQDRNCRVEFNVPASGNYRVVVQNLGPGFARRCDVQVEEN